MMLEASKRLAGGRARNERLPPVCQAGSIDPGGVEAGGSQGDLLAPPPGCLSFVHLSGGIARSSLSRPANGSDAYGIQRRYDANANTHIMNTPDAASADPDLEALRQKMNELILNGRRKSRPQIRPARERPPSQPD